MFAISDNIRIKLFCAGELCQLQHLLEDKPVHGSQREQRRHPQRGEKLEVTLRSIHVMSKEKCPCRNGMSGVHNFEQFFATLVD